MSIRTPAVKHSLTGKWVKMRRVDYLALLSDIIREKSNAKRAHENLLDTASKYQKLMDEHRAMLEFIYSDGWTRWSWEAYTKEHGIEPITPSTDK